MSLSTLVVKEFRDNVRNRWILGLGIVFAALALTISYFGSATTGTTGFRDIGSTLASLSGLTLFLVPLIGLVLGYGIVVDEKERGSLYLLLSMPLSRKRLLIGKYLGLSLLLTVAILAGFGVAGAVIGFYTGFSEIPQLALFSLNAVLLGMAYLSVGTLFSTFFGQKSKALAAAVLFWFLSVLLYDMALLGVVVALNGMETAALAGLIMLNPVGNFRILNIHLVPEIKVSTGMVTAVGDLPGLVPAIGATLLWIVVPLLLSVLIFRRRDYSK